MKIVLIYRNKVAGANSIEELFHTISGELKKSCEIIEYQLGAMKNLYQDVVNLRRLNADVYHITGAAHYIACFLPKRKTMLTIHDIYHYSNDLSGWRKLAYRWIYLTFPLKCIRTLTTISEETKGVLQRNFPGSIKANIVTNCYNDQLFKYQYREFCSDKPVILHIGTKENKNLPRLIEALDGITCQLLIIGKLTNKQADLLKTSKLDYTNVYNLSMDEVYNSYVNSDIIAFVSLAEGFGVPIIEGQAVGRPVLTSSHQPMSNVAGGAACLVDAWSVTSIRDGIKSLISDSELCNDLVTRGLSNVTRFSPPSIAEQYYQLYLTFQNNKCI